MYNPITGVFDRIEVRCPIRPLDIFEPFGGNGLSQVIHYAPRPRVNHLTAWEIDVKFAVQLKKNFPDTDVKVCDAFEEVNRLHPHFDVIIVDNNLLQWPRFEHFDLFPAIFKGLKDNAFMVISVCHDPGGYFVLREHLVNAALGSRSSDFVKDWDSARTKFYNMRDAGDFFYRDQVGHIRPVTVMSVSDMVPIYMDLALKAGFFTQYQTIIPRSQWMKYIVLELQRGTSKAEREAKYKDKLERQRAINQS
jgi:hypothetical protein